MYEIACVWGFSLRPKPHIRIVVGTDGFWADLDLNDQNRFLVGANLTEKKKVDDCSALIIKNLAPPQESRVSTPKAPNIYIVDSR